MLTFPNVLTPPPYRTPSQSDTTDCTDRKTIGLTTVPLGPYQLSRKCSFHQRAVNREITCTVAGRHTGYSTSQALCLGSTCGCGVCVFSRTAFTFCHTSIVHLRQLFFLRKPEVHRTAPRCGLFHATWRSVSDVFCGSRLHSFHLFKLALFVCLLVYTEKRATKSMLEKRQLRRNCFFWA